MAANLGYLGLLEPTGAPPAGAFPEPPPAESAPGADQLSELGTATPAPGAPLAPAAPPFTTAGQQLAGASPVAAAAPPAPAGPPGYLGLLEQAQPASPDAERVAAFLRWRDSTHGMEPEKAAEVLRYAAALGQSDPTWVSENLDAIKREVDSSKIPWRQLYEDHPALRPMLGDPVQAAAIRDESADLPWTQKWLTGGTVSPAEDRDEQGRVIRSPGLPHYVPSALYTGVGVGVDEMALAVRKAAVASPFLRDVVEPWLNIGTGRTYDPSGFKKSNVQAIGQLERSTGRDFNVGLGGQVVLAVPKMLPSLVAAGAVGAVAAAAAPVEGAVVTVGGVAAGAKALFWALQGYGSLHESLGEVRSESGEKLGDGMRQFYAATFSLAAGVAMETGLNRISKGLGLTFEGAAKKVVAQSADAAMANPGLARLFGRMMLEGGRSVATGAAAMAGQAAINATALEFGKAAVDPAYVVSLPAITKAGAEGFIRALPDMLILGMLGPVKETWRRRGEVLTAQVDADRLLKMGESVRASKLRERFSLGYQQLVRATAGEEPGDVSTVYATLDRFDQVAQARGVNEPRELAARIVGDAGEAYDKAKTTNQPLEIPVERYLTEVAVNPELEKQLLPDLRIDANGRTLREAGEQKARDLELMRKVLAEPISESDQGAQRVKADFAAKARAAHQEDQLALDNAENVARVYAYAAARDRPRAEAKGEKPWDAWDFYQHLAPIEIAGWREAGGAPGAVDWTTPEHSAVAARALQGEPAAAREVRRLLAPKEGAVEAAPVDLGEGASASVPGAESLKHASRLVPMGRVALPLGRSMPLVRGEPTSLSTAEVRARMGKRIEAHADADGAWRIEIDENGWQVEVSQHGVDKMLNHANPWVRSAVLQVDQLLARATRAESVEPRGSEEVPPDRNELAYHSLFSGMALDGALYRVRLVVRELQHGKGSKLKQYALEAVEVEEASGEPGRAAGETPVAAIPRGLPRPNPTLRQLLSGAKWDDGTPMGLTGDTLKQAGFQGNPERGEVVLSAGEGLQQKAPTSSDRGQVVFTPVAGGPAVKASIDLFRNSDPSTLAHETGHVFARLLELLASREGASSEVKADYEAMLRAMGYKDAAAREAARAERKDLQSWVFPVAGGAEHQAAQQRLTELAAQEERFAYLWEQYLLEGKAPEASMAGPLGRFKEWLLKVYKSVRGVEDSYRATYGQELGPLNVETRALFDRLLTARDAVKESDAGLHELPGAPPDEAAAWKAAREEAEVRLVRALVQGDREANSDMMKAEREKLRVQLGPALDAEPDYAVVRALQTDNQVLLGPKGEPLKLSRKALTKEVGAEVTRAIAKEHPGIFGPKGEGMTSDQVAELLGLESGKDLVKLLTDTRNRDTVLEERVQQKMNELFGAPLSQDHSAVAEAALSAAASPKAAAAILKEMRRLAKDIGDPTADVRSRGVSWANMVQQAEAMVFKGRVADLTPNAHFNRMKTCAQRAFDAMQAAAVAKTDAGRKAAILRAYEQRDQQLWALAMARAAETQKAQLDANRKMIEQSNRTAWRAELGKADPVSLVYQGVNDSILEAVGFRAKDPEAARGRASIDQVVAKAAVDAAEIDFDPAVLKEIVEKGKPWAELTVAEAWEVSNAVSNLRALANNANELTIMGKRVKRLEVLDLMDAAAGHLPAQPKFQDDARLAETWARSLRLAGQHVDALLSDVATVAHILDGGNRDGVFHQVFVDSRLACREKRLDLTRSFLLSLTRSFEKSGLEKGRLREQISVGRDLPLNAQLSRFRVGETRTRANLIMMALNLGNASNAERFLKGYGWSREQVLDVLQKHLNAKEWRWVQSVWTALEGKGDGPSLYEEMARAHQEETGVRPEKIKATPFKVTSSDGEVVQLEGGYFPARYDPRPGSEKKTGEKQMMDTVSAFFEGGYQREGLKPFSPHAQQRAEHFNDLVNLDWGIVPQHVSQVIQDISYRTWARQTAALILDPRFQNLMSERFGEERAKFFAPWLKSVVNSTSDSVPADLRLSDRIMSSLRGKAAIAAIGWSLPTALGDLTQPMTAVAAGDIKARYLAMATAKIGADYRNLRAFVLASSPEVRMRSEQLTNRFGQELGAMGGHRAFENPVLRGLHESAFITMEMTDRLTTTPIWLAKYYETQAEGLTHEESCRAADDTIRRTFPPEEMATKSRILRSKALTPFLLFYGYANKIWNVERVAIHDAYETWHSDEASVGDKAGAVAKAAGRILAVSVVNGLIGEYFSGRGPEDGESEEEWVERKLIASLFYPLPFIGSLGDWGAGKAVALAHGHKAPLAKPSIRNAPALSYVQDMVTRADKAIDSWSMGNHEAGASVMQAAELLIGLGVGAPMRQVQKTGTAALHQITGESRAAGPIDAFGDLVYGESKQDNPLSWLQRRADGKPLQWK